MERNEYHGGVYWYHRNPALNANYWFNNRDQAADPVTHKAPQARILLEPARWKDWWSNLNSEAVQW